MKKLIILIGISGAGKSTFAHKMWLESPLNTIIVSRDNIRYMFGYTEETVKDYYSRPDLNKLEKQVTKYEDTLIYEDLCENKTVIVDATHLHKDYIKRFEYWNVLLEIKWFDVTLKEALIRDMSRARQVGEDIISKQYNKYVNLRNNLSDYSFTPRVLNNDDTKADCFIFDIDGTIAHMEDRNAYDWNRVGEDSLDTNIANIFCALNRECDYQLPENIIFCSGRDEICRADTLEWLKSNLGKFNNYNLMMRPQGDNRPDWIIKQEMAEEICKKYYISCWFDDRLQVTRHLRQLGLKVLNVEHNNF